MTVGLSFGLIVRLADGLTVGLSLGLIVRFAVKKVLMGSLDPCNCTLASIVLVFTSLLVLASLNVLNELPDGDTPPPPTYTGTGTLFVGRTSGPVGRQARPNPLSSSWSTLPARECSRRLPPLSGPTGDLCTVAIGI